MSAMVLEINRVECVLIVKTFSLEKRNVTSTHTLLTKASQGKSSSTLYPEGGEPGILGNCTKLHQKEQIISPNIFYNKILKVIN